MFGCEGEVYGVIAYEWSALVAGLNGIASLDSILIVYCLYFFLFKDMCLNVRV